MDNLGTTLSNIGTGIKDIAPSLAGLIFVVIGLMYLSAKDPQKKEQLMDWIKNVLIGLIIVYVGGSMLTWVGSKIVGGF